MKTIQNENGYEVEYNSRLFTIIKEKGDLLGNYTLYDDDNDMCCIEITLQECLDHIKKYYS